LNTDVFFFGYSVSFLDQYSISLAMFILDIVYIALMVLFLGYIVYVID